MTPSSSLATLRPDLAGSLQEFDLQANQMGYVGLRIAPVLEVAKQSGHFGRLPIEQLLKDRDTARTPGGGYSRGTGKFEPDTYACTENGTEEPVDDREAEMYADYFDAELVAAQRARNIVLSSHERRVIAAALAIAGTAAGAVAWTTTASATPIDDVRAAQLAIFNRCGQKATAMAMSWVRFQHLKDCAQIIDRVKSSGLVNVQRSEITPTMVAQALGLEEIILAGGVKNTANENAAATIASLWTDSKALVFTPPRTNDIREPAFMRTIHWAADGSSIGAAIETYRDESVRSDVVRARMDTHEKIMFTEAAQTITGI
jgi:hypothetical protein